MNRYEFTENYVIGYDSKDRKFYFDYDDYDLVSQYNWYVHTNGYVRASIYDYQTKKIHQIQMHRLVTNVESNVMIDHISGERNDNRKENLRIANYSTNMMNSGNSIRNTSGKRGVNYDKNMERWVARIQVNNKRIQLGYFKNIEDAINARQLAEEKYYGEYRYSEALHNNHLD